jgi:flagella basal body P-ring formation protein FlgA
MLQRKLRRKKEVEEAVALREIREVTPIRNKDLDSKMTPTSAISKWIR